MKPCITVITLGVNDLDTSMRFYRDGLGFPTEGIVGEEFQYGAVAFFQLQPGLRLALWPRKSIAHDTGLSAGPASAAEVTLGHREDIFDAILVALAVKSFVFGVYDADVIIA